MDFARWHREGAPLTLVLLKDHATRAFPQHEAAILTLAAKLDLAP